MPSSASAAAPLTPLCRLNIVSSSELSLGGRRMNEAKLNTVTLRAMSPGSSPPRPAAEPLVRQLVGPSVGRDDERNGYWFWGLIALFVGVPDVLAGISGTLRAHIPWP